MQNLLYLLIPVFLFINYKIIESDYKNKTIPNKYLLQLLILIPFYYIFIYFTFQDINILHFAIQMFVSLIISFMLYAFGIWGAGDAKYLLVLSFFIPYIGVVPFIGNIGIITIVYLLYYFIYFYLLKNILSITRFKSLYINIFLDLKGKFLIKIKENDGTIKYIGIFNRILLFLIKFLIIFISIRLLRIYLLNDIILYLQSENIDDIIYEYNIYILLGIIIIVLASIYLIKFIYIVLYSYIIKFFTKNNIIMIKKGHILFFLYSFISILLILFIGTEYIKDPDLISKILYLILTIYILIYIVMKLLIYLYNLTFNISETSFIETTNLKSGDIIDKQFFYKIFIDQKLFMKKIGNEKDIKAFLNDIENPLDKRSIQKINFIYKITNHFNKNDINHNDIKNIKIIKTFAFAPYILIGFIITYIYDEQIFIYILSSTINILKELTKIS